MHRVIISWKSRTLRGKLSNNGNVRPLYNCQATPSMSHFVVHLSSTFIAEYGLIPCICVPDKTALVGAGFRPFHSCVRNGCFVRAFPSVTLDTGLPVSSYIGSFTTDFQLFKDTAHNEQCNLSKTLASLQFDSCQILLQRWTTIKHFR
jgi:hypothetical protein